MELVKALELQAKMAVEAANPGKKKEDLNLTEILKEAVPEDLRQLADEFSKKKKLGLVKHGAGSGYGGKGFKFTEDEDNVRGGMNYTALVTVPNHVFVTIYVLICHVPRLTLRCERCKHKNMEWK